MSYRPKVNKTERYSDSKGEHIICEGKLVFISKKGRYATLQSEPSLDEYVPLIISETEKIEVGDRVYHKQMFNYIGATGIYKAVEKLSNEDFLFEYEEYPIITYKATKSIKILALPENFSEKHLQAIVDGKMKDGDDVYVECEILEEPTDDGNSEKYKSQRIYLDQQNHITLFPTKQSLEEAIEEFLEDNSPSTFDTQMRHYSYRSNQIEKAIKYGAEWAKKNNHV